MGTLPLDLVGGRPLAGRKDSRETRRLLVDGIGSYARAWGRPPVRLADVARHVGVSTATAYRHFASLDDLANAHLSRLPEHAVRLFAAGRVRRDDPVAELRRWNRAWVAACLAYADTTVPLRSAAGFLRRRADGDPLVAYVCAHVEPLLVRCDVPVDMGIAVWNAVSDPREVVDLRATLGHGEQRIARHITELTLAVRTDAPSRPRRRTAGTAPDGRAPAPS